MTDLTDKTRHDLYDRMLSGSVATGDPVAKACIDQAKKVRAEGEVVAKERNEAQQALHVLETRLTALSGKMEVLLEMAAKIVEPRKAG